MKKFQLAVAIIGLISVMALAWDDTLVIPKGDISTGKYLYTAPETSASGGLKGRIASPADTVVGVFALCPNQPKWCYRATLGGDKNREFEIAGLPMEKYDLVVLFKSAVYEGLTLGREGSTLTSKDRQGIEAQVQKSEPFFDQKIVLRLEGRTGKKEHATGLALFLRNKGADSNDGTRYTFHRRSIKVVHMMQVGPGWQMEREREIYVNFVKPGTAPDIKDHYRPSLGNLRVTDTVKDLGDIDLTKAGSAARP